MEKSAPVYQAVVRSLLLELAPLQWDRLEALRRSLGLPHDKHEEVLQHAIESSQRQCATDVEPQNASFPGADPSCMVGASPSQEFQSLLGYEAWCKVDQQRANALVQQQTKLPSFMGHLELEVVQGHLLPVANTIHGADSTSSSCLSCFKPSQTKEAQDRIVAVSVSCVQAANNTAHQQTPPAHGAVGSPLVWRCCISPLQVLQPDAQLKFQLMDGPASNSYLRCVGQVSIRAADLAAYVAKHPFAKHSITVPVYALHMAGKAKKHKRGNRAPPAAPDASMFFDPADDMPARAPPGTSIIAHLQLSVRFIIQRYAAGTIPACNKQFSERLAGSSKASPPAAGSTALPLLDADLITTRVLGTMEHPSQQPGVSSQMQQAGDNSTWLQPGRTTPDLELTMGVVKLLSRLSQEHAWSFNSRDGARSSGGGARSSGAGGSAHTWQFWQGSDLASFNTHASSDCAAHSADHHHPPALQSAIRLLEEASLESLTREMWHLFNQDVHQDAGQDMQSPFCKPAPVHDEPIPGGAYWSCLVNYCKLYGVRPTTLRLCLLCQLLDNWPNGSSGMYACWAVEIAVHLANGLMALKEAKLLTLTEALLFDSTSGALLRNCVDIIEQHYEFASLDAASAAECLKATLAGLHTIVGASSGQELAGKLVSFHVSTAVERRTRALLSADKSALRKLAHGLKQSQSLHAVQQQLADVSPELAEWLTTIMDGASTQDVDHTDASLLDRQFQTTGCKPHQKSRLGGRTAFANPSPVSRLTVATAVVLEDLQMDVLLQPVFAGTMDLQALTARIRYNLLSGAVQLTLASKPVYGPQLQLLEDKLHDLHDFLTVHLSQVLLTQADSLQGLADKLGAQAVSCSRQVSGGGGIQLLDIHTLMMPSVDLMIKAVGVRLLEWVDKIIDVEAGGTPAEPKPDFQRAGNHSGTSAAVSGLFRPVSCRALYSGSVIELYRHLRAAVESVVQLVMQRGTQMQKASTARQLYMGIANAVKRYLAHMERSCSLDHLNHQPCSSSAGLIATSASGQPPHSCITTSSSFRAPASISMPKHRRGRSDSAAFASSFSALAPTAIVGMAEGSHAEIQGLSSGGWAGHQQPGLTRPLLSGGVLLGTKTSNGISAPFSSPCITPQLCVLLCSMEEVVQQQVKLEKLILSAVQGLDDVPTPQPSLRASLAALGQTACRMSSTSTDVSLEGVEEVVLETGQGLRGQMGPQALEVMVCGSGVDRLSSSTRRSMRGVIKHMQERLCDKLGSALLALTQKHRGRASPAHSGPTRSEGLENAGQVVLDCLEGDLQSLLHLSPKLTGTVAAACWEALLEAVRNLVCGQLGPFNLRPEELSSLVKLLAIVMEALAQPDPSLPQATLPLDAGLVGLPSFRHLMKVGEPTQQLLASAIHPTDRLIQEHQLMCSARKTGGAARLPSRVQAASDADSDSEADHPKKPARPAYSQPRPLDLLRLLQLRGSDGDSCAASYWLKEMASNSGPGGRTSLMQVFLGGSTHDEVLELEDCSLAGCPRPGHLILSSSHLVFTTLLEDGKAAAAAADSPVGRMMAAVRGAGADLLQAPDVTLVMSLGQDVERVDTATHKGSPALAITALKRTRHVLHSFKPQAAARVLQALRLHVMGLGTPLDKALRGLDGGHGGVGTTLDLPPGETLMQTFTCSRYGMLSEQEGVLYLCASMLVFDTDEQRLMVRYADIDGLRMEKDWRGTHWVQVTYTCDSKKPLWLSPGGEQQALELLTAIAAQGAIG